MNFPNCLFNSLVVSVLLVIFPYGKLPTRQALSQPRRASVSFYCDSSQGVPTTVAAHERRGTLALIEWEYEGFASSWTPEERCEAVSRRLNRLFSSGDLRYIVAGSLNGYPVLCASPVLPSQRLVTCSSDRLIMTLRFSDDPEQIILDLSDQNGNADGGDVLIHSGALVQSGNSLGLNVPLWIIASPSIQGDVNCTSFFGSCSGVPFSESSRTHNSQSEDGENSGHSDGDSLNQSQALTGLISEGRDKLAEDDVSGALELFYEALTVSKSSENPTAEADLLVMIASVMIFEFTHEQTSDVIAGNNIFISFGNLQLENSPSLDSQPSEDFVYLNDDQSSISSSASSNALEEDSISQEIHEESDGYTQAISYYEMASELYDSLNEKAKLAETFNHIGIVQQRIGKYSESLVSFNKSISIYKEIDHSTGEGNILNNLGETHRLLGQYSKALDSYNASLSVLKGESSPRESFSVLNNIGLVYYQLGDYSTALSFHRKSLDIRKRLEDSAAGQATSLHNLGLVYYELHQDDKALEFYESSIEISQKINDHESLAATQNNLALVLNRQGYHAEALEMLQQAADIFQRKGMLLDVANTLDSMATVYKNQNRHVDAEEAYRQSLAVLDRIGNNADKGIVLTNLGDLYEKMGSQESAVAVYKQVIDEFVETTFSQIRGEKLKSSFASKHANTYSRLIMLLWEQKRYHEAFNYVERARSRVFLNQVFNGPSNLRPNDSDAEFRKIKGIYSELKNLKEQIFTLSYAPDSLNKTEVINRLQEKLTGLEQEYTYSLDKLKQHDPELADLVSVNPAELPEIQSLIPADTTLIEYFVVNERVLVFLVTRETLTPVALDINRKEIEEAIDAIREYDFAALDNPHSENFKKLHEWLFEPLKPYISTNSIGIIPHDLLHYVPFAALSDGEDHLVNKHTLFNLPSANVLRFLSEKRSSETGGLVALGNPTLDLKAAQTEVETITPLYNTSPWVGYQATESQFWAQAKQAEILHVATHSDFNPINPLFSSLKFAPSDTHDGRLEVHEIYGLDLTENTNLVVLSACQSQVGTISNGDEIISLHRAFMYAGTPSIVASLWNVDDEATSILMEYFYRNIQDGMNYAESLQKAQIKVSEEYAHPYYWAGFVLTGDQGKE